MNLLEAQAAARAIVMIPQSETETHKKLDAFIRDAMESAYDDGYAQGTSDEYERLAS